MNQFGSNCVWSYILLSLYTSHIKLSTVYMYPYISSWRHSEKRADSNQARAYKAQRRGIKLTRETALARENEFFIFHILCRQQACCNTGTVTATLHFLSHAVTRSPRPSCTLPVDTGSLTHCCLRFHHWLPHNKKKNNAFWRDESTPCVKRPVLNLMWLVYFDTWPFDPLILIQGSGDSRTEKNVCANYLQNLWVDLSWICHAFETCCFDVPVFKRDNPTSVIR